MSTPETLLIVGATFLAAGMVKGVIGLGLPTLSLALLTTAFGLHSAMALLLFPSFVTNLWQAVVGGRLGELARRLWPLLAAVAVATWFGVEVLAGTDTAWLSALLGVLIATYAGLGLSRPRMPSPGRAEAWLSPAVGAVNGVLTGMTGSFVVPGVPYLQSLGLSRDALVQAMGLLFTVSTVALAAAMGDKRLLSLDQVSVSAVGVVPALVGMVIGQAVRQRLSEAVFTKAYFAALLVLGGAIVYRALA